MMLEEREGVLPPDQGSAQDQERSVAAEEFEARRVQADRMIEAEFEKALWKKALQCGSVLSEAQLKGIFIEGIRL